MHITKYKYFIGVSIFLLLALWSLFEAYHKGKTEIVTMLVAVIGYFAFMVVDRIETASSIERLESAIVNLTQPINQLHAQLLLDKVSRPSGSIKRLSSRDAFNYSLAKIASAQSLYNTSFSNYQANIGGPLYPSGLMQS